MSKTLRPDGPPARVDDRPWAERWWLAQRGGQPTVLGVFAIMWGGMAAVAVAYLWVLPALLLALVYGMALLSIALFFALPAALLWNVLTQAGARRSDPVR